MSSMLNSLSAARQDAVTSPEPQAATSCPPTIKDWIEIVLEDQNGVRIPKQEYLVTAPDGAEYSGVLDRNGYARVDGITPGACQVSFPRIDQSEWKKK
jgi:hypothetical protein